MAVNEPPAGMDADEWEQAESKRRYRRRGQGHTAVEAAPAGRQWYGIARIATCWIVILALALDFVLTVTSASDKTPAGNDPSAIQVMQVYVEGAFYAICAIGVGIAVYIGTRSGGE